MMTPIDIPAVPAKAPGEAPGRRGAKSEPGDDGQEGPGKGRFADHWRILAGPRDEPAPGDRTSHRGVEHKSETPPAAGERARSLDQVLDGLRLVAEHRAGPERAARSAEPAQERAAPGERILDPAAALRVALGGETGASAAEPGAPARTAAMPASPEHILAPAAQPNASSGSSGGSPKAASARQAPGAPAPTTSRTDLHLSTRGADAPAEPLRARVLHQATHFAPVGDQLRQGAVMRQAGAGQAATPAPSVTTPQVQPSGQPGPAAAGLGLANLQNIASAIAQATADNATSHAPTDTGARPDAPRPGGPLRTLTIQLTPISLGKVTVEMRLVDGAMRVDITVADARALEMVRSEREPILALVRNAGVTPESVTIQSADQAQAGRQNGGSAQNGGNAGGGFGEGAHRREDAPRDADPRAGSRLAENDGRSADETSGGARGGGRDIYL
ncbi:MAG: hypothetical protein EA385_13725 [Salinarimonadaceae bacterium]|nr:MAG: hypothetical protein EA385_13725 [Salinarimonadaceae bacterium]